MSTYSESIEEEYWAARTGAVLRDASHWGRLNIRGKDHLDFLHRMTTNDFNRLTIGQGCEAVFIEQRARIIDVGVFYRGAHNTLLIVSPDSRESIPTWLDRFIFAESIEFEDITEQTAMLECSGPQVAEIVQQTLSVDISQSCEGDLIHPQEEDAMWLARTDWDGNPGFRAVGPPGAVADLRAKLADAGVRPMSEETWEILRIEQGIPLLGKELTDAYNPWEAGLGRAVHMDKGCYIGQEVIARLDTYDKIKQHLVGLRFSADNLPVPGEPLLDGHREVGRITSAIESPSLGPIALAYVRRAASGSNTILECNGVQATVVSLPFAYSA